MFSDIPVDVGVVYEGERIRKGDMYVELGGPKVPYKCELAQILPVDQIEDGKIEVIGPDLDSMEQRKSYCFGIHVQLGGEKLDPTMEGVFERHIHIYLNYVQGFMHLNQRNEIWCRLSKEAYEKGLNSLKYLGKALYKLFKSGFPIIEKIQITFYTDTEKVKELLDKALKIYEERDARVRGLKDEEVDAFYGCLLCQSFAPSHVCVITPSRPSACGAVSWLDAKVGYELNPKGPNFKIEKGELLDEKLGEYSGVNDKVRERSLSAVQRVFLHSALENPHTSCGCFEALVFYIPEVDGFGIVHRDFKGPTVNGLPFSTMAGQASGGKQIPGLIGIGIEYMKSPKFLQADGGWSRVVWLPLVIKERVKNYIPEELYDKIATENDAKNIDELRAFLESRKHPVIERLSQVADSPAETKAEVIEEKKAEEAKQVPAQQPEVSVSTVTLPFAGVQTPISITLKGVKIHIDKLIIKRSSKEE